MSDKVVFDRDGSYHVGDRVSEMDVQAPNVPEGSKSIQHTAGKGRGENVQATASPIAPAGRLDLAALKAKAATQAAEQAPVSDNKAKAEEDVAPVVQPQVVEELVMATPEVVTDDVGEPVAVVEEHSVVQPGVQATLAEPQPEEKPVQAAESPVKKGLTLNQLQGAATAKVEQVVSEESATSGVKHMDLGEQKQVKDAGEMSTPKNEGVKESPVSVADAPVDSLEVADMMWLLQELGINGKGLHLLGKRAASHIMKYHTSVVGFKQYAALRVYGLVPDGGDGAYMCFGIGGKVTLIHVEFGVNKISDVSRKLSIVGTFAMMGKYPVAHTGQTKIKADVI